MLNDKVQTLKTTNDSLRNLHVFPQRWRPRDIPFVKCGWSMNTIQIISVGTEPPPPIFYEKFDVYSYFGLSRFLICLALPPSTLNLLSTPLQIVNTSQYSTNQVLIFATFDTCQAKLPNR